jgi:hypothetical protein
MAGVPEIEVLVAHSERATVRVGDVFLKVLFYRWLVPRPDANPTC